MNMINRKKTVVAFFFVCVCVCSYSAVLEPEWRGESGTAEAIYHFETNVNPPVPSLYINPYGGPVSPVINLGTAGEGWQVGTDLNIDDTTGYWGLGLDGTITFTMPFEVVLDSYTVDFMFDVIGYKDPFLNGLPELSLESSVDTSNIGYYEQFIESDPEWGGSWDHTVMTGQVTVSSITNLVIKLQAPSGKSSPIQDVAIYTRTTAIPEPAVISLILGGAGLLLLLKRRFQ